MQLQESLRQSSASACRMLHLTRMFISDSSCGRCTCRRYTLPLEEFYTYNGTGPNITAYINGEPKSHQSYNCSIHCGGQQFCGAGNPGRLPFTPLAKACTFPAMLSVVMML